MNVYMYGRWSSLEQSKGSTLERQLEVCASYAAERGWDVPPENAMWDRGISAYSGANISHQGKLGQFGQRVVAGAIEPNSVLIVEQLDRLSRRPPDVMLAWMSPIVRSGLTIHVAKTGQIINTQFLDHDQGGVMTILISAFGAYAESDKKADRIRAAWAIKRDNAREGLPVTLGHRRPKWVSVAPETDEFEVSADKREIIKLIFARRIAGVGKTSTAKELNQMAAQDDRFAVWDAAGVKQAAYWTPTYVSRILRNRAVMGEWAPQFRKRAGPATGPAGEPIANFYPQVIDPATYAQAQEGRIADALKHQGRGQSLSNLLGTRARCAWCDGQMSARGSAVWRTQLDGSRIRHYYLYCAAAKLAKTCENQRGWVYDMVERHVLDRVLDRALDDQHFKTSDDLIHLESDVNRLRGEIAELRVKKKRLLALVELADPDANERYLKRAAEIEAATTKLAQAENALAEARGAVSPTEHIRRVSEVRALLDSDDEAERYQARKTVKAALGDLIQEISFDAHSGNVSIRLINNVRHIVIDDGGEIISDYDMPAREGYGLDPTPTLDQQVAAEAYERRREADREKRKLRLVK